MKAERRSSDSAAAAVVENSSSEATHGSAHLASVDDNGDTSAYASTESEETSFFHHQNIDPCIQNLIIRMFVMAFATEMKGGYSKRMFLLATRLTLGVSHIEVKAVNSDLPEGDEIHEESEGSLGARDTKKTAAKSEKKTRRDNKKWGPRKFGVPEKKSALLKRWKWRKFAELWLSEAV